jgi:hypothetical protein
MSFIAVPPTPAAEQAIENDGFFPAIDPTTMRPQMRIDGTVTAERLREALIAAILAVNADLAVWRDVQLAAGYTTLEAVPAWAIAGISANMHRYLRAVRCLAGANLTERYRDHDSTNDGHLQADRLDLTVDDLRRDARWAVRDILGAGRSTVELI